MECPAKGMKAPRSTGLITPCIVVLTIPSSGCIAADRADPACPSPQIGMPDRDRPLYDIRLSIDRALQRVQGDLSVRFTPDLTTERLIFRLWPNGPLLAKAGTHLRVGGVLSKKERLRTELRNPTTLVV